MKLKVVDVKGADIESIEVEDSVFGITCLLYTSPSPRDS